eukprot:CAMPEP_0114122962 /NCGR_PEP_ID=MMETSP0043_2-20121206/7972_1 /TAXON_ID=464988 /ORGANISM="Hemiselmis andersenii, Strain CCMP644" /LENGTH=216 /DNA_ID=CAMNT_0001215707 /DNA_START=58 /DNA_END=704 /DNA_ORIENTATION=-
MEDEERYSISNTLRGMCARARRFTVQEVRDHLLEVGERFGEEERERILNTGNQNGKTVLHCACQLRESPEIAAMLLGFGAKINATTRRGHTALIFASGRGRSDTVIFLLQNGANPLIITVTGDTAESMAVGKVNDEALGALRDARASWGRDHGGEEASHLDFRKSADALKAQEEHCRTCRLCQEEMRRRKPLPPESLEAGERRRALETSIASAADG